MRTLSLFTLALFAFFAQSCASVPEGKNPLANMSAPKVVASGFISTEGPVWHAASQRLFFSDIPGNKVYALSAGNGQANVLRGPSDNANGLALYQGGLLMAEQASRSITLMDLTTKAVTSFAATVLDGGGAARKFNSPNDMAVHKSGAVYFTDPPFAIRRTPELRELAYNGVFRRDVDGVITLIKSFDQDTNPNGIIFNPDETILYLAVSDDVSGPILAFDVDAVGNLSGQREFSRAQNTDGMAMDSVGNLYVATRTGIEVLSAQGRAWGKIIIPDDEGQPMRTTNVAFGGKALDTLYITGRSEHLYAVTLTGARGF